VSQKRANIPRPLRRKVELEAGHRCAIPTCRATSSLEVHHIKPWAKSKEHKFSNLILLCANCHGRCTKGEIDQKSMKQYKANLAMLNAQFSHVERRLLDDWAGIFADSEYDPYRVITLPIYSDVLVAGLTSSNLLKFLENRGFRDKDGRTLEPAIYEIYRWTEEGYEFLRRHANAKDLHSA